MFEVVDEPVCALEDHTVTGGGRGGEGKGLTISNHYVVIEAEVILVFHPGKDSVSSLTVEREGVVNASQTYANLYVRRYGECPRNDRVGHDRQVARGRI